MKRRTKILLVLLFGLIVIQFIQPAKNQSAEILSPDLTKALNVPGGIQKLLKTACYDCHSNNTSYPWYSRIQPFGWMQARHINNGKAELNFSDFGSYSARRQISKLTEIVNSVKDGTMPLGSYKWMHKDARLSQEQKDSIINWATDAKESLRLNKQNSEK